MMIVCMQMTVLMNVSNIILVLLLLVVKWFSSKANGFVSNVVCR